VLVVVCAANSKVQMLKKANRIVCFMAINCRTNIQKKKGFWKMKLMFGLEAF